MAITTVTVIRGGGAASPLNEAPVHGNDRVAVVDLTMDATAYAAGGVPIPMPVAGLSVVKHGTAAVKTTTALGNTVQVFVDASTPTAPKIKANAAAAEVGAVSLVGMVVEAVLYGS